MTAFPADAKSNLFEGPYPEFFQALAHFAYPGDFRRIREARSEWNARNPCEYPPLYDERGWDAPKTGEAFKAIWLKLEDGAIRAWRRMRKDGPYKTIDPSEWHRRREDALALVKAAEAEATGATDTMSVKVPSYAPNPVIPSLELRQIRPHAGTEAPLVGDPIDPRILEHDFFIVVLNVAFLRDVVVSRDDVLKRASAALAAGAPPDAPARPDSAIPFDEVVSRVPRKLLPRDKVVEELPRLFPAGRGERDTYPVMLAQLAQAGVIVSESTLKRAIKDLGWVK